MDIEQIHNKQPILLRDILPVVMVRVKSRMLILKKPRLLRAALGSMDGPGRPGRGLSRLLDRLAYQLRSRTTTTIGGLPDRGDRGCCSGRSVRCRGLGR